MLKNIDNIECVIRGITLWEYEVNDEYEIKTPLKVLSLLKKEVQKLQEQNKKLQKENVTLKNDVAKHLRNDTFIDVFA